MAFIPSRRSFARSFIGTTRAGGPGSGSPLSFRAQDRSFASVCASRLSGIASMAT